MKLSEKISDVKYAKGAEIERTSKVYTRAMVPEDSPKRVLDIGCGVGVNARALAEKGHEVVGIDISVAAIEKFRAEGFEGEKCDIEEGLCFADEAFDVVFASEVIEHLVDSEHFVAEVFRVLRPGGTVVLSTPNSAFWVYRAFAVVGRTVSDVQHPGHIRFFTKKSLTTLLRNVGFRRVTVAGRNMYMIVGEGFAPPLAPLLRLLGFRPEMRFRTQREYWHLSHFAKHASGLWTDTLIATARKLPENGAAAPNGA